MEEFWVVIREYFLPLLRWVVGPIVYAWGAMRMLQWDRARRYVNGAIWKDDPNPW
jgi:hypothetical protein